MSNVFRVKNLYTRFVHVLLTLQGNLGLLKYDILLSYTATVIFLLCVGNNTFTVYHVTMLKLSFLCCFSKSACLILLCLSTN